MSPTILVVGATGNTGRSAVSTLSELLTTSSVLAGHQILALTRSTASSAAQALAKLPHVKVVEQNWVEITSDWLREREVVRVFIASHNEPPHFAEESEFHLNCLLAGVKYVVRISTTAANVRPDCRAYYPRTHWAIEALLSSPEFKAMHWTSLQPNVFSQLYLGSAAHLIKHFHETGKQETLKLMASEDAPVGIIDPHEIGVFAGRLLASADTSIHNHAKYVLNGPEDITGRQIVEMVEQHIGNPVENVEFQDMSFLDGMIASTKHSKNVMATIRHAPETAWDGLCSTSTTSKEFLEIAPPSRTPAAVLESLLQG